MSTKALIMTPLRAARLSGWFALGLVAGLAGGFFLLILAA